MENSPLQTTAASDYAQGTRAELSPAIIVLHTLILWGFAVAQPLCDLLKHTPEYLVIQRVTPAELKTFLALLFFALPASVGLCVVFLRKIFLPFGKTLYFLVLISLFALALLPSLHGHFPRSPKAELIAAFSLGTLLASGYSLLAPLRTFVSFLAPALIAFPFLFARENSIHRILFPPSPNTSQRASPQKTPPVVMLVFDEFPLASLLKQNGEINAERFPHFARLASRATFYPNATSVSGWTEHAVPAILSGRYPEVSRVLVPSYLDYPNNLFTLLGPSYRLNVYEQITHLCPDDLCKSTLPVEPAGERAVALASDGAVMYGHLVLPPRHARKWLPRMDGEWGNFIREPDTTPRPKGLTTRAQWSDDDFLLREFTSSLNHSSIPTLHFVHVTFPHVPYRHYPSGKTYHRGMEETNERGFIGKRSKETWPAIRMQQRFLLQVAYLDALLGQILDKMQASALWDESLFVLTADHGLSFQPGQFARRLSPTNVSDILNVPLFIKYPAQSKGQVSIQNMEAVDILPTILTSLGIELELDGTPAQNRSKDKAVKKFMDLVEREQHVRHFTTPPTPAETLKLQAQTIGHSLEDLYRIGPRPDLLGKRRSELKEVRAAEYTLLRQSDFESVDLRGSFLPGLISGKVKVPEESCRPMPLLILLNERVAASGWSEGCSKGWADFSLLVREKDFIQGRNAVEVLFAAKQPTQRH